MNWTVTLQRAFLEPLSVVGDVIAVDCSEGWIFNMLKLWRGHNFGLVKNATGCIFFFKH